MATPRTLGETGIEVLATAAELAVAEAVGPIGTDEGVVDANRRLEQERLAVEKAHLLGLSNRCAYAGGRIDTR
jgi:hypothetical protein